MEKHAEVGRGATSLYIANIASLIANSVYYVILTNFLRSTYEVGVVTELNILIWFLVPLCIFAQPVVISSSIPAPLAVLKFVPEFLARGEKGNADGIMSVSIATTTIMGLLYAAILWALPSLVIPFLGGEGIGSLFVRLSALDMIIISVGQVALGAIIALGETGAGTVYIVIWNLARYCMASILLVFFGVFGVLVGWIGGDLVLLLLAVLKSLQRLHMHTTSNSILKDLFKYNVFSLSAALLSFAIGQSDRLIALSEQGLPRLAIYNVAITASNLAGYGPYALLTVLLPAVAALYASGKTGEMRSMIRAYTRYVSLFVTPIAFGLAAVIVIPLRVFGADYLVGTVPAVIIGIASGVTALGAVYAGTLLALAKLRWYVAANLLGMVGLFAVAWWLTPILGLTGTALGRACLSVIATLVYAVAMFRSGIFEIDWKAYLAAVGSSAIMGVVVFSIQSSIHSFVLKLVMSPIFVLIGLIVYVGSLRLSRILSVEDIDFLRSLLPKGLGFLLPAIAALAGVKERPA